MLGFEELNRPDFDFPGAWFRVGHMPIHLTTGGDFRGSDLDDVYQQLIDGPVTVTLATQASDRVQLNAMWFEASPDRSQVYINTVKGRAKDAQLRKTGTASIQAINPENPYHWVTLYCDVDEVIDESDSDRGHLATESIDRLAKLYLDADVYPLRNEAKSAASLRSTPQKSSRSALRSRGSVMR